MSKLAHMLLGTLNRNLDLNPGPLTSTGYDAPTAMSSRKFVAGTKGNRWAVSSGNMHTHIRMHAYRLRATHSCLQAVLANCILCWQSVLVLLYDRCPTISLLMPTRWGVLLFSLSLIVRTQATCSDTLLHQKPDHYKGKGAHTGKAFWDGTLTKQNAGNYWRAQGHCCPNPAESTGHD